MAKRSTRAKLSPSRKVSIPNIVDLEIAQDTKICIFDLIRDAVVEKVPESEKVFTVKKSRDSILKSVDSKILDLYKKSMEDIYEHGLLKHILAQEFDIDPELITDEFIERELKPLLEKLATSASDEKKLRDILMPKGGVDDEEFSKHFPRLRP